MTTGYKQTNPLLSWTTNCKNAPFGSLLDAFPCNWPIVVFTMRDITLKSTFWRQLILILDYIAIVAVGACAIGKVLSGLFHNSEYILVNTNIVYKSFPLAGRLASLKKVCFFYKFLIVRWIHFLLLHCMKFLCEKRLRY